MCLATFGGDYFIVFALIEGRETMCPASKMYKNRRPERENTLKEIADQSLIFYNSLNNTYAYPFTNIDKDPTAAISTKFVQ